MLFRLPPEYSNQPLLKKVVAHPEYRIIALKERIVVIVEDDQS
jgi:hypothetical protein